VFHPGRFTTRVDFMGGDLNLGAALSATTAKVTLPMDERDTINTVASKNFMAAPTHEDQVPGRLTLLR
jgi:hypothetical protein